MAYDVIPDPSLLSKPKEVRWENDPMFDRGWPTLAEMVEAAQKEFPGVPFKELMVSASGYDAEIISLERKR